MNVEDLANAGYVTEAEGEGYDRTDEMKQEAVVPAPPREPTPEMIDAVQGMQVSPAHVLGVSRNLAAAIWQAMHDAAAKEVVPRADEQQERVHNHYKAVAAFLSDLYAIMVDPLADGQITVEDMQKVLIATALKQREDAAVAQADEQDARRYRYLRDRLKAKWTGYEHALELDEDIPSRAVHSPSDIDAAIDAAMGDTPSP